MSSQPSWIVRINLRGLREKTCCCFHHTFVIGFLRALLTKFEICVLHFYQHKIPSEMEVAPHYKLLILFTLHWLHCSQGLHCLHLSHCLHYTVRLLHSSLDGLVQFCFCFSCNFKYTKDALQKRECFTWNFSTL